MERKKGYTHCPNCGRVKDTGDQSVSNRQVTEFRKSKGICTHCGREQAEQDKTRCRGCIINSTLHKRISREVKLKTGLCSRCGKEPLITGEKR